MSTTRKFNFTYRNKVFAELTLDVEKLKFGIQSYRPSMALSGLSEIDLEMNPNNKLVAADLGSLLYAPKVDPYDAIRYLSKNRFQCHKDDLYYFPTKGIVADCRFCISMDTFLNALSTKTADEISLPFNLTFINPANADKISQFFRMGKITIFKPRAPSSAAAANKSKPASGMRGIPEPAKDLKDNHEPDSSNDSAFKKTAKRKAQPRTIIVDSKAAETKQAVPTSKFTKEKIRSATLDELTKTIIPALIKEIKDNVELLRNRNLSGVYQGKAKNLQAQYASEKQKNKTNQRFFVTMAGHFLELANKILCEPKLESAPAQPFQAREQNISPTQSNDQPSSGPIQPPEFERVRAKIKRQGNQPLEPKLPSSPEPELPSPPASSQSETLASDQLTDKADQPVAVSNEPKTPEPVQPAAEPAPAKKPNIAKPAEPTKSRKEQRAPLQAAYEANQAAKAGKNMEKERKKNQDKLRGLVNSASFIELRKPAASPAKKPAEKKRNPKANGAKGTKLSLEEFRQQLADKEAKEKQSRKRQPRNEGGRQPKHRKRRHRDHRPLHSSPETLIDATGQQNAAVYQPLLIPAVQSGEIPNAAPLPVALPAATQDTVTQQFRPVISPRASVISNSSTALPRRPYSPELLNPPQPRPRVSGRTPGVIGEGRVESTTRNLLVGPLFIPVPSSLQLENVNAISATSFSPAPAIGINGLALPLTIHDDREAAQLPVRQLADSDSHPGQPADPDSQHRLTNKKN